MAGAESGPTARYKPPIPFTAQLEVKSLGDIPSECYGCCTWTFEADRWKLKYPNGFCPSHGGLARGLNL